MANAVAARRQKKAPAVRYQTRDGFRLAVKAEVVGTVIEQLKNDNGGEVTPSLVVAESRPEDAPLHPCFEWHDPTAANLYREDQARCVIRSYVIVRGEPDDETIHVANVSVTNADDERVYVSASRAMNDEDMRAQVIADTESMLRGIINRYRGIPGLSGLLRETIERVIG